MRLTPGTAQNLSCTISLRAARRHVPDTFGTSGPRGVKEGGHSDSVTWTHNGAKPIHAIHATPSWVVDWVVI